MINDNTKEALKEFFGNSPYSVQEQEEISLFIDGVLGSEPSESQDNLAFKQQNEVLL